MSIKQPKEQKQRSQRTPTFLLELPLAVNAGQAKRIRGHLEAGRQFYNAMLSQGQRRLRRMQADPAWQEARAIPQTHTQERRAAFSEYAFHDFARKLRVSWLADHLDAVLAQTLATRAYRALNRVCAGEARRVRFRSRGRGLSSIENKRHDTCLRFVLQKPEQGNRGYLVWKDDQLEAVIDWEDEVVTHGLRSRIKYGRLVQRKASSQRAAGADALGFRYVVQIACEGSPHRKKKHAVGSDTVGCNAAWIGKGARPIRATTMHEAASRRGASSDCAGRPARAMSRREAGRPPKNANWQRIARACMGVRFMRSSPSATPSFSKSFRIKRGRNSMDVALDCERQGCL